MIPLYVFALLAGVGYYVNKRQVERRSSSLYVHKGDIPSMENMYESRHTEAVDQDIRRKNEIMYLKSLDPSSTGVISREYASQAQDSGVVSKLAGVEIPLQDFKHNNMVPFFGGRVKQNLDNDNGALLERYTGATTDLHKRKKEVEYFGDSTVPNMGNVYGSTSETYETELARMQGSTTLRNNELPFEQVRVGPGLNKGYGSAPSGGFQQADTRCYAMPKGVDELRVATKPKLTYEGRYVAGQKELMPAEVGEMRKNRVETFYQQGEDRYLTTTGAVIKETGRPETLLKYTTRKETSREYAGIPGQNTATKARACVQESSRQGLTDFGLRNAAVDTRGKGDGDDYGKSTIMVYTNERDITGTRTYEGNLTSAIKALIAPLQDLARNTHKEYTISHPRTFGQMQVQIPEKATIYDPNDVARTTIKETLIHDTHTGNITGPTKLAVYDPDDIARTTMRETLDAMDTGLNLSTGTFKGTVYDPDDVTRTTMKETLIESERDGNLESLVKYGAYEATEYEAKTTHKQFISDNDYAGMPYINDADGYKIARMDPKMTQKQFLSDNDYVGVAESSYDMPTSYDNMYNAIINDTKELLLEERVPTASGNKVTVGKKDIRLSGTKKLEADIRSVRLANNMDHIQQQIPSKEFVTLTAEKPRYKPDDRLDIAVLSGLRDNPYNISVLDGTPRPQGL